MVYEDIQALLMPGLFIHVPGDRFRSGITGEIIKVNRVNIIIACDVSFCPGGPVYHQEHKWR